MRNKTKIKESIIRVKRDDGTLTEEDCDIATVMNKTLASVFTKESETDNIPDTNYNYSGSIQSEFFVTNEMVLNILKKLNSNKSAGPERTRQGLIGK